MADEKKTIILTNKGKRPWDFVDVNGAKKHLEYLDTIELDEAKALRLILDYPRDFTQQGVAGPSSKDIARMEQSIRDRTANLDAREKAVDEREKKGLTLGEAVEAISPFLSEAGLAYLSETEEAWKDGLPPFEVKAVDSAEAPAAKKRGRPAKAE